MYFPNFSSDARIWIYLSNKPIEKEMREEMNRNLDRFIAEWSAHGTKLQAAGNIIDEYRLVLCTDGNVEASGCSIDASVRFIKEMGQAYTIDFFNRLQVLVEHNHKKELMPFSQLNKNLESFIYHPSPENLGAFRLNEKVKIADYLER